MSIPTKEECIQILTKNKVPENIIQHSKVVANLAVKIATKLQKHGINVNIALTMAGALLHDVKRLSQNHSLSGARFLEDAGFLHIAEIVRRHGLKDLHLGVRPQTIEEKIVFYADKQVNEDRIVSIRERIDLLKARFPQVAQEIEQTYEYIVSVERELQRLCPEIIE
ncbi:MAG: HD domain-containing protein [Candidatus Heimdallarchaeota archaeon]